MFKRKNPTEPTNDDDPTKPSKGLHKKMMLITMMNQTMKIGMMKR
jgi:hypothetical protein